MVQGTVMLLLTRSLLPGVMSCSGDDLAAYLQHALLCSRSHCLIACMPQIFKYAYYHTCCMILCDASYS